MKAQLLQLILKLFGFSAAVPPATPPAEQPAQPPAAPDPASPFVLALIKPPAPASSSAAGAAWRPLPGQLIELGYTGWQIKLGLTPGQFIYTLFDPEGAFIVGGSDLPAIKALAERFAREREEFDFPGRQA